MHKTYLPTLRFKFLSALTLAWLLVFVTALPGFGADDDDYRDGVGHYNKGRWKLAAAAFDKFLKDKPTDKLAENATFYLGLTQINLEDHKLARETLRGFLTNHSKSKHALQARYWVGQCSYLLSDDAAALKELSEFVDLAGEEKLLERALTYLGELELKPEALQLEKAVKHLELAVSKFPMGEVIDDSRYFLAQAYAQQMQGEKARKLYNELAAKPDGSRAPDALLQLGILELNGKNFGEAVKSFQKLEDQFSSSPLLPLARLNRGIALYREGQFAASIDTFDKVAADPRYGTQATFQKALAHKSLNQYEAAIAAFRSISEKPTAPEAEDASFQWGMCELQRSNYDAARERFLKTLELWPKGKVADHCLYRAAVAALAAGKHSECDALLTRFDKEFAGNKLRHWQGILRGRLLLESSLPGTPGDPQREAAVKVLEGVLEKTMLDDTRISARYYLAQVLQVQKQYDKIVAVTEPLAAALEKDPAAMKEFGSALVLRGGSALTLGKKTPREMTDRRRDLFAVAMSSAERYLTANPAGASADQALAVHAMASAHAGKKEEAEKDLSLLRKNFVDSHWLDDSLLEVGQVAYSAKDYVLAEQMFAELANYPKPRLQPLSLLELGSTRQQQAKYAEAASVFARLSTEFPDSPEAPEAGYLQGQMLELDNKIDEAQKAFHTTFVRYGMTENAYRAGRSAARLLSRMKKIDEADTLYAAIADRFKSRKDLDQLLDDWAVANYAHERFKRADELFARLATEFPDSELADNARLSLAETELVNGRGEAAKPLFRALADSPGSDTEVQQRARYQLIQIELEAKRWKELRLVCQEMLEKFPKGNYAWDARFHAAESDFQTENFPAAQAQLIKLRDELLAVIQAPVKQGLNDPRDKPWYAMVWVMLAETQFREKKYAEAQSTAAQFAQVNPKSPYQYYLDEILGRVFKQQAKFAEAREAFQRVVNNENSRATETAAKSQFHIGETYFFEKDYTHAVQEYLKVQIRYKYPEWQGLGLFQAAGCYEAMNEWKEAVKTYEDLLKDFPKHSKAAEAQQRLTAARKQAGI